MDRFGKYIDDQEKAISDALSKDIVIEHGQKEFVLGETFVLKKSCDNCGIAYQLYLQAMGYQQREVNTDSCLKECNNYDKWEPIK